MMDLVMAPELIDAMMERIFGFWYEHNTRCFETLGEGVITTTYVAEDLGTQESLLMSEELVDRFLKPKMKRMCDLAHQFGIFAFHHSDGAVRPLIPGMIDIGIDILNPIQWRCAGMEREGLMADFGDRLVFHGAVDNQHTLPFGTPADVRAEVAENIAIFKDRYICAPCHNIQPNTPTENIVALYEAAHETSL
jgi:uroporphyrinogen decarboxylase